jgi:hypothetical protein
MVNNISNVIVKATGRVPNPSAKFAAVGIDSLAAVIFRNVLSQSLGGVFIDPNELFDMNTTIESFAIKMYDRLSNEKPNVLEGLHISYAADDTLEDGQHQVRPKENQHSVGRVLLMNRQMLDGLRGFIALLVLLDHFFLDEQIWYSEPC